MPFVRRAAPLVALALLAGCGKPPDAAPPAQAKNAPGPPRPNPSTGPPKQPTPVPFAEQPGETPLTPGKPPAAERVRVARYKVIDTIPIGPGREYESPPGSRILWVRVELKKTDGLPRTLDLTRVRLKAAGQPDSPALGVGFGASDEPSINHLLSPNSSGTITTSGPAIGEVIFDAGLKTVTFARFPTDLSLIFLVPSKPKDFIIEGLFGETVTAK
jgi:hypothetical protein